MFNVNDAVWIHAMGSYYAGTVTKKTDKRLLVSYTSGAGKTREKWVTLDEGSQQYINSKHETSFPLVAGAQPKPAGARVKGGGLFAAKYSAAVASRS